MRPESFGFPGTRLTFDEGVVKALCTLHAERRTSIRTHNARLFVYANGIQLISTTASYGSPNNLFTTARVNNLCAASLRNPK